MKKRSRSVGTWDYLPTELVEEEILWRLPAESIIRCGGVCKSWYSLIRSRKFISIHLHKSRKAPLVFLRKNAADRSTGGQLSFILENPNHPFDLNHLDCRVLRLPTDPLLKFNLLGCCNGVICLYSRLRPVNPQEMTSFILCNPSISRSLTIPMPHLVRLYRPTLLPNHISGQLLGFGFTNPDYKIMRIVISNSSTDWAAELYSLNLNSWRAIPIHGVPKFDFVKTNTVGAFVKGRLHWIVCHDNPTNTGNFILVFDLNHETFHHISFPKCLEGSDDGERLRLLAFQESSIVLVLPDPKQRFAQAWTLEQYGASSSSSSWKTTAIDLLDSRLVGSAITNDHNFIQVVKRFNATPLHYVPSLVLLDKQNNNT